MKLGAYMQRGRVECLYIESRLIRICDCVLRYSSKHCRSNDINPYSRANAFRNKMRSLAFVNHWFDSCCQEKRCVIHIWSVTSIQPIRGAANQFVGIALVVPSAQFSSLGRPKAYSVTCHFSQFACLNTCCIIVSSVTCDYI
jgi:hypothetical protein